MGQALVLLMLVSIRRAGRAKLRLTHIKLSGFKSFVDPSHIPVPGRRVGVVGPNGCGKSNVIDAVRWVLGESSARQLRGETMQDVIFNGAGGRRPANRASVELVFDNSLGRPAGAWSRYAEISVKRVLERNGDSEYYINHTPVRRKDVADVFLGTGLGGRAYAIIEQGMISRVIESRPEELRVFLEEAAGISKYRERRRETQARLEDTAENLTRVDDILRELGAQVGRLDEQAKAAAQYRDLMAAQQQAQQLAWLLRRQEAGALRERFERDSGQAEAELEQAAERLGQIDSGLEALRVAHFGAGDGVHTAQGALYETNAVVARLEQGLQYQRDARRRIEARQAELAAEAEALALQLALTRTGLEERTEALEGARLALQRAQDKAQEHAAALPQAQAAFEAQRAATESCAQALAQRRQALQVESTRVEHASRVLGGLALRIERLEREQAGLDPDDPGAERERLEERQALEAQHQERREALGLASDQLDEAQDQAATAQEAAVAARRTLESLEAQLTALTRVQQQVSRAGELAAWVAARGLGDAARLWQALRVEAGWEDAVEAVLRERLNALAVEDFESAAHWLGDPPPGKVSLYRAAGTTAALPVLTGVAPLANRISLRDDAAGAVLAHWLSGVYAVEDAPRALELARTLPCGLLLVTREGHAFSATSVSLHAADSEVHGILARQREIEALESRREGLERDAARSREAAACAQERLTGQRGVLARLREEAEELQQQRHEIKLAHVQLTQRSERSRQRREQIDGELEELRAEQEREQEARAEALERRLELDADAIARAQELEQVRSEFSLASVALDAQRAQAEAAARRRQEAGFNERLILSKMEELEGAVRQQGVREGQVAAGLESVRGELGAVDEAPALAELDEALGARLEREGALSAAREALGVAEGRLRAAERERLGLDQHAHALRERLGALRLRAQEGRLAEEGFATQLREAEADEVLLQQRAERGMRPAALQADAARLGQEISALGAVNLAALAELEQARERHTYLEHQASDLREAVATLEGAISRIDRESRERLQETFEQVNRHFGEIFPSLFGGGEARLVLTGEDMLEAGIQVIARPPGKRNSSIHLLSGGEKALTALSLVFSLFNLNPAPFCLLDEVDAPLDDSNVERFCELVKRMSEHTQFLFISHNKITMQMAEQLIGVTMPEQGVSRVVAVDVQGALSLNHKAVA